MAVFVAQGLGRYGKVKTIIADVARAGTGVTGELMHGIEGGTGLIQQHILRPVSMVYVEIKHGGAFGAGRKGFQNRDRDVAQITEAHSVPTGRVRAWGTHQTKDRFAFPGSFETLQPRADGRSRQLRDVW